MLLTLPCIQIKKKCCDQIFHNSGRIQCILFFSLSKWFFFHNVLRATFISCSISWKLDCLSAHCFCQRVAGGLRVDHWPVKTKLPQNSENTDWLGKQSGISQNYWLFYSFRQHYLSLKQNLSRGVMQLEGGLKTSNDYIWKHKCKKVAYGVKRKIVFRIKFIHPSSNQRRICLKD